MPAPKKNPLTNLVKKGVKKAVSKGKAKVEKRVANLNDIADYRTSGNYYYEYKKKMLKDVVAPVDLPIKVKPRNLGKITKQRPKSQVIRKYYGTPEQRTRTGRKTTPMPVKKNTTVKKRSK